MKNYERAKVIAAVIGSLFGLLMFACLLSLGYLAYYVSPHWVLFDYQKIRPVTVQVGKPLEFVSIRRVNFNVSFTFNEVLFCERDGVYRRVIGVPFKIDRARETPTVVIDERQAITSYGTGYATKGKYVETVVWRLNETNPYVPREPAHCILDSYISATKLGVTKTQHMFVEFDIIP
jgi:hypothetical protein